MECPMRDNFDRSCRGVRRVLGLWVLAAVLALTGAALGAAPLPNAGTGGAGGRGDLPANWFGVAVESLQPAIAEQLKLKPDQGVMVMTVFAGSPAEKAGIRPNDLLIELNGKPLTSQEDLAKAANTVVQTKAGPSRASSEVAYLRKGDRRVVQMSPEPRPAELTANAIGRQPGAAADASGRAQGGETRNMVLSNGVSVQYGPGYQIDASSGEDLRILRQAVGNGQSVTFTSEKDGAGKITNTISDGRNTYVVDPKNPENVPANLRPLVGRIAGQTQATAAEQAPQLANTEQAARGSSVVVDERLKRLEQQNDDLRKQIEELKGLLLKASSSPATSGDAVPANH
jgi:hypothetical protein